jgi:hypothetical protein
VKSQVFAVFLVLLLVFSPGCVRRRLSVRTQPAGAAVYIDKQYIGNSPTATSVTYYGTREIEVIRDGYRTEKVLRTFNPPWYQLPPLDFLSETLWPGKIRDERIVDISMVPQTVISSEQLQGRANNLRMQAAQGVATPLPPPLSTTDPGGSGGNLIMPVDPSFPPGAGAVVGPPHSHSTPWQPGQFLRDLFQPGGAPATRFPETGILPGGGYRPEM